MILLDTNVISELAKLRPTPSVLAWIATTTTRFGAKLATRSCRRFACLCLDLVDPFAVPP